MGRGSGSIRPHLAVLLLLTGVLAGLLLRTPVPSVPTPLPQGEVGERIAAALPAELSPLRRAFVESGAALVGRVGYFWGGKSKAGWNDTWGEPRVVTSAGSKNTGKVMPYGLDCSGFVDWVFKTSGYGNIMSGGTAYQWGQCAAIKEENLQPGDLVFKNPPNQKGVNHIGIYLGERNGQHLYVHCAGGEGVTMDSWSGFIYFRRPLVDFGK